MEGHRLHATFSTISTSWIRSAGSTAAAAWTRGSIGPARSPSPSFTPIPANRRGVRHSSGGWRKPSPAGSRSSRTPPRFRSTPTASRSIPSSRTTGDSPRSASAIVTIPTTSRSIAGCRTAPMRSCRRPARVTVYKEPVAEQAWANHMLGTCRMGNDPEGIGCRRHASHPRCPQPVHLRRQQHGDVDARAADGDDPGAGFPRGGEDRGVREAGSVTSSTSDRSDRTRSACADDQAIRTIRYLQDPNGPHSPPAEPRPRRLRGARHHRDGAGLRHARRRGGAPHPPASSRSAGCSPWRGPPPTCSISRHSKSPATATSLPERVAAALHEIARGWKRRGRDQRNHLGRPGPLVRR